MADQNQWQELVIVLDYNLRGQADLFVTKLPTALNALLNNSDSGARQKVCTVQALASGPASTPQSPWGLRYEE